MSTPKPHPITFLDEHFQKTCPCGATFTTRSRLKPLCDPCQREKTRRKMQRLHKKLRAKS